MTPPFPAAEPFRASRESHGSIASTLPNASTTHHHPATSHSPLRILQVVDSLDIGGGERHVVELARALQRQGHQLTVACSAGGPWCDVLEAADIEVRVVAPGLAKRQLEHGYAEGLRRLLRQRSFDLVHAHLYASTQAAVRAICGTGLPLVITHHSEEAWQTRPQRRASALAARQAWRVIAVSRPIQNRLIRRFRIPADRVSLVPNAVPAPMAATASAAGARRGPVIGMVARLSAEKGTSDFLQAAALIARFEPACRFLIAGDGPSLTDARALSRQLGVSHHTEFLGALPDARLVLGGFDIFAVPSSTEGSPLTILEAMAAGVPVVATEVGGIPDQMRHHREGFLVPAGDPSTLALACLRILEDGSLRRQMGQCGRARVAHVFSHQRMVQEVLSIYSGLAAVSYKP